MSNGTNPEDRVQLFIYGREFLIGPDKPGDPFDLKQQLVAARLELNSDLAEIISGNRLPWVDGEDVTGEIKLIGLQQELLDLLIAQATSPVAYASTKNMGQAAFDLTGEPEYVSYPIPR